MKISTEGTSCSQKRSSERGRRRGLVRIAGAGLRGAVAMLLVFTAGAAAQDKAQTQERVLSFFNTHTAEHLSVAYKRGAAYIPEALAKINHILRDPINGEVHEIDPGLLDFLWEVVAKLGFHKEVEVVCGYRSSETNTTLHKRTSGVVLGSMHLKGKAIDFRLPGILTRKVFETARAMLRGGTGYYAISNFVQIDTGPVRQW